MKKKIVSCGIVAASFALLFAFAVPQTSITGKVTPADGANMVWAVSGTDSAKAAVNAGAFSLQVKPGTYKVVVDAKDPYKDVLLENIEVKQDQPVDVGEIVLQK